jgi:CubicO group peptidase (beta-lactamase class C family)
MSRKIQYLIFFILVFTMNINSAQPQEKIPDQLQGFETYVNERMQEWNAPGVAIGVVKDNKIIYQKGFGYTNIETKQPVTPETIFAIGSNTKLFTATAAGILVDEGKLIWEQPVKSYLPLFGLSDEYASNHATIIDLLSHRTGLPTHDALLTKTLLSRYEIMEHIPYLETNKEIRQLWQYNNLMYIASGCVVEKLSGKTWEDFVQEKIFTALEMSSSNFSVHTTQKLSNNYALPYQVIDGKVENIDFADIDAIAPAGAINSNVIDMSKWLILHLNKGKYNEKQIISEKSLKQIHTPHMLSNNLELLNPEQPRFSYGLGVATSVYEGVPFLMHSGTIAGFHSLMIIIPEEKIGIIVLSNGQTHIADVLAYNIFERLLDLKHQDWNQMMLSLEKKKEDALKSYLTKLDKERILGTKLSHSIDSYAGTFNNKGYGIVKIEKTADHLTLKYNKFVIPLYHYHYDIFQSDISTDFSGMLVTFGANSNGTINQLWFFWNYCG